MSVGLSIGNLINPEEKQDWGSDSVLTGFNIYDTIRYDMIRYDTIQLYCQPGLKFFLHPWVAHIKKWI